MHSHVKIIYILCWEQQFEVLFVKLTFDFYII